MPNLLQINTSLNYGSTGRIAEQIGIAAKAAGWNCYIAHGARYRNPSQLRAIQVGSLRDELIHGGWYSLLLDRHGLGSIHATRRLIHRIDTEIHPDIIHLHNIHGYYLNYRLLFEYLAHTDILVIWTLHDCWPFTGHCTHFDQIGCMRWETECHDCPQSNRYPRSLFIDCSQANFHLKQKLFTSISDRLTLVPVSEWLSRVVKRSFLGNCRIQVIHNGVDTGIFTPCNPSNLVTRYNLHSKRIILGVASQWDNRKGFQDFVHLRTLLSEDYIIVLIGLTRQQCKELPNGMLGIERTQNIQELVQWYSVANVLLSLSREETFGMTIIEAMSCGTPAIVYNATATPELIHNSTGFVVEIGDWKDLISKINIVINKGKDFYAPICRAFIQRHFDKDICYGKYIDLYNRLCCTNVPSN